MNDKNVEDPVSKVKVVIGDDHPLVQAALSHVLAQTLPHVEVIACYTLDEVMAAVGDNADDIDLILLDLLMPGTHGFAGLFMMLKTFPTVPVAIISSLRDGQTIRKAIDYGASGYVPKALSTQDMAAAIDKILNGEIWFPSDIAEKSDATQNKDIEIAQRFASLSVQQMRILAYIVEGQLNKQIAGHLGVSEQTIKIHVSAILKKLDVNTRTQAAILAERLMAHEGMKFQDRD